MQIPQPKGKGNRPSNSVNQNDQHAPSNSGDSLSTIDLQAKLDAKRQRARSEKARPRGNDL